MNSASAFAGDGTSGVFVYGWQWELGSFATSRIYNAWNTTSTSSVLIGGGARTFTITLDATNPLNAIPAGSRFNAYTPDYVNGVIGTVTSHTGTTLVVNVNVVVGAGTYSNWVIGAYAVGATRNADVATITGTNFSDWFNASEGTFVVQSDTVDTTGFPKTLYAGTVNDAVYLDTRVTSVRSIIVAATTNVLAKTSTKLSVNTFSAAYKLNNHNAGFNGAAVTAATTGAIPTGIASMSIGSGLGSNFNNGHVYKILYYPQRLTDAELRAFTK